MQRNNRVGNPTTQTDHRKAWTAAIAAPATEFPLKPLPVLAGTLPEGLRGSLYRNGPARLERGGERVGHWFDGDGAVLAVHFAGGHAQATYRYVRSAGYVAEEATGHFLYSGYGTLAPGPLWRRWQAQLKNAANTSVLPLGDRVLALWEGGRPHQLDAHTLDTHGTDDLAQLAADEPYSAHPKYDPKSQSWFNFGLVAGANATLNLYRSNAQGRIQRKQGIPLNGIPLIHDFVFADRYLVFCVPPLRLNALPAVLGFRSFSDALMWQPKRGTQIVVVDAESLEVVSWEQTDPWFQWHFGNGYLDDQGDIVLDVVRYPDFTTNRQLQEIASGQIRTPAASELWQVRIDPQTAAIREQRCRLSHHCEFPQVATDQPIAAAPTYLSLHRPGVDTTGELFGAIARLDAASDRLTVADAGENRYPSEPVYVPNAATPGQGWVLTVVYDGNQHQSEVWIYVSDRLNEAPICRLGLPSVVPPSFHGRWQPLT